MSAFHIHGPAGGPAHVHLHGVVVAASVAVLVSDPIDDVPADLIRDWAPFAGLSLAVDDPTTRAVRRLNLLTGWEGVAATVGQLQRWLDQLPVGRRDQAAAVTAEAYRTAAAAYRQEPPLPGCSA